jgi:hypothetical protein
MMEVVSDINRYLLVKLFISLLVAIVISLTTFQHVNARNILEHEEVVYDLNYRIATSNLLVVNGNDTTNNELYFLACVARTHLERNESIGNLFHIYPAQLYKPTQEQIDLVKDVINNNNNKCYDLYVVLPLSLLEPDSQIISVVVNDLAFITYKTFILLTVQPNL